MNAETLKNKLLGLSMNPENLHVHFDMDGTLYEWKNLSVDIPSDYEDMDIESRNAYMQQEVYKQLLTPGYYQNLALYPAMAELMNVMHEAGVDVWVNSCSINSQTDNEKRIALSRDFPWLAKDRVIFVPDGRGADKASYLCYHSYAMTKKDVFVLIDDHTANCKAFENTCLVGEYSVIDNCSSIKCKNNVNCKGGKWQGATIDYDNADIGIRQFIEHLEALPYIYERGKPHEISEQRDDDILQRE